jgi:hypothetical protein
METRRGRNQAAEELKEAKRKCSGVALWMSLRALMLWRVLLKLPR